MTKMGAYISLEMNSLPVGTKFKKDQVIASTKNFDKNGTYCSGKNAFMAVMNYMGMSHEDSYVVTDNISQSMSRDIVKEAYIVVPPDTKILNLEEEIGKIITDKDLLVEFSYSEELEEYIDIAQIDDTDNSEILSALTQSQGTMKLMGHVGEIVDIKVFINNKNSIDKRIVNLHSQRVRDTKRIINKLADSATNDAEKLKAVDNMSLKFMKTGIHKLRGGVEFEGAKVVYYIKQKQTLKDGDKIATRYGAKGVIGKILNKDETPVPEFSPRIDMFIGPRGVFSRKNLSMIKELYIGKIIYFLNEKIKTLAEDSKVKTEDIVTLILDVYRVMADKKVFDSIQKNIESLKPATFRSNIKTGKAKFVIAIPPFTNIKFEQVKSAADILDIPLDEKVYVPELGITTKTPVPVGVTYIQALEQTAEIYCNVRSAGKYSSLTGQPTKGKAKQGGQNFGNLDVYALSTYDTPSVLTELMTIRSDAKGGKRQVVNSLITTGKATLPPQSEKGNTNDLMEVYMKGMGLNII